MARPANSVLRLKELTPVQLAYLAGFLDGEGHFAVQRTAQRSNGKHYYVPILQVVQAGERGIALVEALYAEVGKVGTLQYQDRSNLPGNQQNALQWMLYGAMVEILCFDLYPYLRLKKRHAEVLMDWPHRKTLGLGMGHGTRPDVEVEALQIAAFEELRALNRRGKVA